MEMQLSALRERKESVPMHSVTVKSLKRWPSSLAKTPGAYDPSRMQDGSPGVSLGEILKEQVAEMRDARVT